MPGLIDRLKAAATALGRTPPQGAPHPDHDDMSAMLGAVGGALLGSSRAANEVESTLHALAVAYGHPDMRSFVLPTLVLVEDESHTPAQTSIYPSTTSTLRLDQAGDVEKLVSKAAATLMPPAEVVAQLARIRSAPPRFGPFVSILGHTILTVGFGLVLNPTLSALPVYVVLGAIVGTIVVFGSRMATLALILPVFTAFAVTLLTTLVAGPLIADDALRLVAPALVSFLPGLTLTIAAVELTSQQIVAGASRMVYGIAQLALLAFGVFAALVVLHVHDTTGTTMALGPWAPWVGIVLTALGFMLFSDGPKGAYPWILAALLIAYSAQLLGNLVVGAALSGFVGAVVVVPAVRLIRLIPGAPPAAVMMTCAYWLLVPGSLGFIGLTEATTGADGATDTIVQTFVSLLAIALGMMVGAGISRDASAVTHALRTAPPTR